jgi:hypothetical protein
MKLRPCEILQPSAAINQSQAAILGWSTIYSGFVWTCSPVCTIAGPDLLDIWVCPKLGWWSPKFHLPIKRESPLNGCGSENNMKKHEKKHSHRSSSSCSHWVILHGSHVPLTNTRFLEPRLDQRRVKLPSKWTFETLALRSSMASAAGEDCSAKPGGMAKTRGHLFEGGYLYHSSP